jgi:nucleoid DNA-binding protein
MNKEALLDELYEVYKNTENEEVYEIVGKVIDFVKKEV